MDILKTSLNVLIGRQLEFPTGNRGLIVNEKFHNTWLPLSNSKQTNMEYGTHKYNNIHDTAF